MSGNANSYVEPKRLLLGGGDIFINGEFVGSTKGVVTLTPSVGFAMQRPGNMLANVKMKRTTEDVTLEFEVCDFKLSQLRRALGYAQSLVSGTTVNIRARDQIQLGTTTLNVTTSKTMIANSLRVFSLDRATRYVSGTDYSATLTTIARKSGAISSGQYVVAEYNFADSGAKSLIAGGELSAPPEFLLQFVHTMSDGKRLQVEFFRAVANTAFAMAFNDLSSGNYTTHGVRFAALVDTTKPDGSNLWRFTEEDAPLISAMS